jgi:hypothetical protein
MHGGLLADVAIILAASFPLLFLGKRFRIPEVIAYLVTGLFREFQDASHPGESPFEAPSGTA